MSPVPEVAPGDWAGPTYHGRPSLKPAPFNNWVVGGYIALAGLSGATALLGSLAERQGMTAAGRRARYLSLLAPTLGSALLVWDLHTPLRFYNMFRVAKATSPMSIGTWVLTAFSGFGAAAALLQLIADRLPGARWARRGAQAASIPTAVAGAGMSTYTAALLAATSTPAWAAAPQAMAVRFGGASVASAAAALSWGEPPGPARRALDTVGMTALAVELAAGLAQSAAWRQTGVSGSVGATQHVGATGFGALLPLGLHALSRLNGGSNLSRLAGLAAIGGSLVMRVAVMQAGDRSAERPEASLQFAQPSNLPLPSRRRRRRLVTPPG